MKYCKHCGAQVRDEAIFCPSCGCSTESQPPAKSNETSEGLRIATKFFMILSCCLTVVSLVGGVCAMLVNLDQIEAWLILFVPGGFLFLLSGKYLWPWDIVGQQINQDFPLVRDLKFVRCCLSAWLRAYWCFATMKRDFKQRKYK